MMNNRIEQGGKLGTASGFLYFTYQLLTNPAIKENPELPGLIVMAYATYSGIGFLLGSSAGYLSGKAESTYYDFFKSAPKPMTPKENHTIVINPKRITV